jgi:hypothetical protein
MDCEGLSAITPHNYRAMSLTEITHAEDGVDVPDVIAEKEATKAGESAHEAEMDAIVSILFSPVPILLRDPVSKRGKKRPHDMCTGLTD